MRDGEPRDGGVGDGLRGPTRERRRLRGVPEDPLDELAEAVVVHGTGGRHDDAVRRVVLAVVVEHLVTADGADALRGAADRAAQRVPVERGGEEGLARDVRRVVGGHREFLEDDPALDVERVGLEHRAGHHVADHLHRHRDVGVPHTCVVAGVLLRGGGVVLATDGVERDRDVEGAPARGALEEQVFQEVRRAELPLALVAGADTDPEAEARRARPRDRLGQDPNPGRQHGSTDECAAGRQERRVLRPERQRHWLVHRVGAY
ncbi:putative protease [Curtobacterium sp. ER1/6]|nr:putative protease [Curtobacterium sp. ER1/6]